MVVVGPKQVAQTSRRGGERFWMTVTVINHLVVVVVVAAAAAMVAAAATILTLAPIWCLLTNSKAAGSYAGFRSSGSLRARDQ